MGGPLHLTYGGWGGQAGGDIRADHLHQAHLPRLLLLGAGGLSQQAAEQVQGEQAGEYYPLYHQYFQMSDVKVCAETSAVYWIFYLAFPSCPLPYPPPQC